MAASTGTITTNTNFPQLQTSATGTNLEFTFDLCATCNSGTAWRDGVIIEFVQIENWMAIKDSDLN